jgi:hypothetical protein
MIELLLTVAMCWQADRINDFATQTRCKEREFALISADENMTPMRCMMIAPSEIAKWIDSHPKWHQRRWTCRVAGQFARI